MSQRLDTLAKHKTPPRRASSSSDIIGCAGASATGNSKKANSPKNGKEVVESSSNASRNSFSSSTNEDGSKSNSKNSVLLQTEKAIISASSKDISCTSTDSDNKDMTANDRAKLLLQLQHGIIKEKTPYLGTSSNSDLRHDDTSNNDCTLPTKKGISSPSEDDDADEANDYSTTADFLGATNLQHFPINSFVSYNDTTFSSLLPSAYNTNHPNTFPATAYSVSNTTDTKNNPFISIRNAFANPANLARTASITANNESVMQQYAEAVAAAAAATTSYVPDLSSQNLPSITELRENTAPNDNRLTSLFSNIPQTVTQVPNDPQPFISNNNRLLSSLSNISKTVAQVSNDPQNVIPTPFGPAVLLPGSTAQTTWPYNGINNTSLGSPPPIWKDQCYNFPIQAQPGFMNNEYGQRDRKFQRWTDEEDELLRFAAGEEGGPPYNWKRIARKYFANNRSYQQCKCRWKKALLPGLKRGQWKKEEDQMILQLKEKGMKWSEIATILPGRISEHVRERYINFLDPNIKKTPWTEDEVETLYQAQQNLGNQWAEISKLLPGRSENAVKNRWHNAKMAQRRKMRRVALENARELQLNKAKSHAVPIIEDSINAFDDNHDSLILATNLASGSADEDMTTSNNNCNGTKVEVTNDFAAGFVAAAIDSIPKNRLNTQV